MNREKANNYDELTNDCVVNICSVGLNKTIDVAMLAFFQCCTTVLIKYCNFLPWLYICEIKLFLKYLSLFRRPIELMLFQCLETCLKLFQNYSKSLLQLVNIFEHVQCRPNNYFETISAAKIILFQFQTWLRVQ